MSAGNMEKLVLAPGESYNLFKLIGDSKSNDTFTDLKQKIRVLFKDLKIVVTYKDIYGVELEPYEKSLSWFGRHLA